MATFQGMHPVQATLLADELRVQLDALDGMAAVRWLMPPLTEWDKRV